MRKVKEVTSWVVYKMTVTGNLAGPNAVCEQGEWDDMELAQPGHHALIKEGIASEAEAERLAREAPGGTGQAVRLKPRASAPRQARPKGK